MPAFRETPREIRDELTARRAAARQRGQQLHPRERRALVADISADLDRLEEQLDTACPHDPIGHAEEVLRDYEVTLEGALAATRQRRVKQRQKRWALAVVIAIVLTRFGYGLQNYREVAASCATHFHCGHSGRCEVGFFHDGSLGVELHCIAKSPESCAAPCRDSGRCELVGYGCAPTRAEHCLDSTGCREHGRCDLSNACNEPDDSQCRAEVACR